MAVMSEDLLVVGNREKGVLKTCNRDRDSGDTEHFTYLRIALQHAQRGGQRPDVGLWDSNVQFLALR